MSLASLGTARFLSLTTPILFDAFSTKIHASDSSETHSFVSTSALIFSVTRLFLSSKSNVTPVCRSKSCLCAAQTYFTGPCT